MKGPRFLCAAVALAGPATAQQFPLLHTPYQNLGLSQACYEALNTTVDCVDQLANLHRFDAVSVDVLHVADVVAVCNPNCKQSLLDLRDKIDGVCQEGDLLNWKAVNYPASYVVERYLYFYDVSCYKNRNTGQFCDMKLAAQRLGNTSTSVDDCDDCTLGPLEVQVNSKIAHIDARGDALVEKFHSLVSSCSASGYSYTAPSPYGQALATTASGAATAKNATTKASGAGQDHRPAQSTAASGSPPASWDYVVQDGDTCNSIAAQNSVSMFSIVQANSNLDVWCRLLTPGKIISIPEKKCIIHKVGSGDTCRALGKQYGATEQQIIDWNANINKRCTNLERWESSYICVGL